MKWNKALSEVELAIFREYVISAMPSTQQVEIANKLTDILLTDARIECLFNMLQQQSIIDIPPLITAWYQSDIKGEVTPSLLAKAWLTMKNNQPILWKLLAWLRYPAYLSRLEKQTDIGVALHSIWEQSGIKRRSVVRSWLYYKGLNAICPPKHCPLPDPRHEPPST